MAWSVQLCVRAMAKERSFSLSIILGAALFLLACTWVKGVEVSQAEIANRKCLGCHGQSRMATLGPADRLSMVAPGSANAKDELPARPGLYVKEEALGGSVHKSLACVDCHAAATQLPHQAKLGSFSCTTKCHNSEGGDFLQGVHAAAQAKGNPQAPNCATCHGGHDILPKSERNSRIHPLNIVKVCADCHQKHQGKTPDGHDSKQQVAMYLESVHGRAVSRGGLAVAATCADCHGNHRILPATDARSSVNREHVAVTCGKCHIGLEEAYQASVHGQQLAAGNTKAPVCTDCHTAHQISRTDTPEFMLDIVAECGSCHDRPAKSAVKSSASLYETYRRSYHGQTNALGFTRAARCSDCHGAHDIRRIGDPDSRLSGNNRIETCRKCHKEADVKFAAFQPHADYRDGDRYPLLHGVWLYFVVMMSAAFGFFGMHSLFWLVRSIIDRMRGQGTGHRVQGGGAVVTRFSRVDRINHAFVIISFFGLTLTGLPLLFSDEHWGKVLGEILGGVRAAGILHRFFAIMLICNFAVHFGGVARRIKDYGIKRVIFGPNTLLPKWRDVKDCLGMFRWFFLGGKKPKFEHWTYWEKFDYVAEVGGSMIIGFTGLMLWFPLFFSHYLPGWMFNIASVVHGYEAMLAIGFIFTIHFFNANLRMEKFPVDDVMFTGRMPEAELKEERGDEYDRLVKSGEIEKLRARPPHPYYRIFAVSVGVVAMSVGMTLVVLIVLAGLRLI